MSNELAISVAIGAVLRSGFTAVFGRARDASRGLGREIDNVRRRQERLGAAMARAVAHPARNLGQLNRLYVRMGTAINNATRAQERLNNAIARQDAARLHRRELRSQMGETAGHAMVLGAPVAAAVRTFTRQEDAETELKITMMNKDGGFGLFEEVRKGAAELGAQLPGTTTEFYNLAKALKSQGISDQMLANGGLRTSAELNVLMNMDQQGGGEFFAKMIEARGLKESEFSQAADLTQRAYFAFGLKKEDMFESMKYSSANARILNLTGLENYKKLLAIEGAGAQIGLEGSQFGTNFSMMLTQLAQGPIAIKQAKKGMKKEAKAYMEEAGVSFEFFDKKGKFKGLDAMIGEIEKLNIIKEKLGEEKASIVADEFFGTQASRAAMAIALKGRAGIQANIELMQQQADMQARIKLKTATLSAALESLGGVAEATAATFGSIFADDIKAFAAVANRFLENTLQPWLAQNKGLIKSVLGVLGGFFAAKMGALALSYGISMALMPLRAMVVGVNKVAAVWRMAQLIMLGGSRALVTALRLVGFSARSAAGVARFFSGSLRLLGSGLGWVLRGFTALTGYVPILIRGFASLGGKLILGSLNLITRAWGVFMQVGRVVIGFLPAIANAFMALGRFLLMTPIGIALTLMATAAYLLYTRWDGVVGGAKLLWQGLSSTVGAVANAITGFFANAWANVQSAFNGGLSGILALIANWSPLGVFYQAFAAVMSWFGVTLPAQFTGFGGMLIDGLVNGIQAAAGRVMAAIQNLAQRAKNAFASVMDIHSPSRVFRAFGGYITQGLAIGVNQGASLPVSRVAQLAGSLKNRFAERMGGFRSDLSARLSAGADGLRQARSEQQAQQQGAGDSVVVHFAPTINTSGGGNRQEIETALQMGLREFEQLFRRMMAERERRAY